jgi:hypothetical protein
MMSIQALQQTAATGIALPGRNVAAVAAAAELGRSAKEAMDSSLLLIGGLVLRICAVILALFTAIDTVLAMGFRFYEADEVHWIKKGDLELGTMWGLALLLFFAPDCRLNAKRWFICIIGAIALCACVSGLLIWKHEEQDRFRSGASMPNMVE